MGLIDREPTEVTPEQVVLSRVERERVEPRAVEGITQEALNSINASWSSARAIDLAEASRRGATTRHEGESGSSAKKLD